MVAVCVQSVRSAAGKSAHSRVSWSRAAFSDLKHRSVSMTKVRSPAIGLQVLLTSSVGTSAAYAATAARLATATTIALIGKRMRSPSLVTTKVNGAQGELFQAGSAAGARPGLAQRYFLPVLGGCDAVPARACRACRFISRQTISAT